jgi:hypothetical protein
LTLTFWTLSNSGSLKPRPGCAVPAQEHAALGLVHGVPTPEHEHKEDDAADGGDGGSPEHGGFPVLLIANANPAAKCSLPILLKRS